MVQNRAVLLFLFLGFLFIVLQSLEVASLEAREKKLKSEFPEELALLLRDDSRSIEEKIQALQAFEITKAPQARGLGELFLELKDQDGMGSIANACIAVLRNISDEKILEDLRDDLEHPETHLRVRNAYFKALSSNADQETYDYLLEISESPITTLRVLVVNKLGGEDAYAPAFEWIKDEATVDASWRVRVASVLALERYALAQEAYKDPCIRKLIQVMGASENAGRLVGDCVKALQRISGEDYGGDPLAWSDWWRRTRKEELEGISSSDKERRKGYRAYNISSFSKQLVFVIDTSISMKEKIKESTKQESQKVITGQGKKKSKAEEDDGLDWDKIETRLDLAREELKRTLRSLDEETFFTLISYSTQVKLWKEEIVPATPENKEEAIAFLDTLECASQTNIFGSLEAAFLLAENNLSDDGEEGKGKRKRTKKSRKGGVLTGVKKREGLAPDTIYFLSDGFATTGKYKGPAIKGRATPEQTAAYYQEMDAMLEEIRERNEILFLTIHTIGIGRGHDAQTLGKLAEEAGGSYVAIGME